MEASAKPLRRTQAYEAIKRGIITGTYPPGTEFQETRLAEGMKMSKTPVRDALARLAQEGLVDVYPRVGYIVRGFSATAVQELFDYRAILEGAAAERAARSISEMELARLEVLAEDGYVPHERETYADALQRNREFHLSLARASRNSHLVKEIEKVLDQVDRVLYLWLDRDESGTWTSDTRTRLLEALRRHDGAEAREIMERGLREAQQQVVRALIRQDVAGADPGSPPPAVDERRHRGQ